MQLIQTARSLVVYSSCIPAEPGAGLERRHFEKVLRRSSRGGSSPGGESTCVLPVARTMRDWLIGMACNRIAVTYGDVMSTFNVGHRNLRRAMSLLGDQSRRQGEPLLTALIVSKATGKCSIGIEKEFGVMDDATERARLYDFWHKRRVRPPQMPQSPLEQRAARFARVEARPGQAAFRRAVFLACHGKCVVSGCDIPCALDAAHRAGRDWRLGQNSSDDGYLLRKDLHALYDAGLLTISPDGVVQLDPTVVQQYQQFAGITVPA